MIILTLRIRLPINHLTMQWVVQSPSQKLEKVTIIPYTINYKDTVGLFGKENHFVRVNVN